MPPRPRPPPEPPPHSTPPPSHGKEDGKRTNNEKEYFAAEKDAIELVVYSVTLIVTTSQKIFIRLIKILTRCAELVCSYVKKMKGITGMEARTISMQERATDSDKVALHNATDNNFKSQTQRCERITSVREKHVRRLKEQRRQRQEGVARVPRSREGTGKNDMQRHYVTRDAVHSKVQPRICSVRERHIKKRMEKKMRMKQQTPEGMAFKWKKGFLLCSESQGCQHRHKDGRGSDGDNRSLNSMLKGAGTYSEFDIDEGPASDLSKWNHSHDAYLMHQWNKRSHCMNGKSGKVKRREWVMQGLEKREKRATGDKTKKNKQLRRQRDCENNRDTKIDDQGGDGLRERARTVLEDRRGNTAKRVGRKVSKK